MKGKKTLLKTLLILVGGACIVCILGGCNSTGRALSVTGVNSAVDSRDEAQNETDSSATLTTEKATETVTDDAPSTEKDTKSEPVTALSGNEADEKENKALKALLANAAVKEYMSEGMKLVFLDDTETVDGKECLLFALGTDTAEQFVREILLCTDGEGVYFYDAVSDTWSKP